MDIEMLRAKMAEKGINAQDMAKAIGVDQSTFYRKIENGGKKFTVGQVCAMVQVLRLTARETTLIFFNENSHKCDK